MSWDHQHDAPAIVDALLCQDAGGRQLCLGRHAPALPGCQLLCLHEQLGDGPVPMGDAHCLLQQVKDSHRTSAGLAGTFIAH